MNSSPFPFVFKYDGLNKRKLRINAQCLFEIQVFIFPYFLACGRSKFVFHDDIKCVKVML